MLMGPHGENPDPHQHTNRLQEYERKAGVRLTWSTMIHGAMGGMALSIVLVAVIVAAIFVFG